MTFKPEPDITLATIGGLTDREYGGFLHCQFIEYAEDHGQEAANEYVELRRTPLPRTRVDRN